ncbi:MAG: hypothetical protein ABSD20_14495 [Terriglobales bacterium]|jgi:predicted membrane protein
MKSFFGLLLTAVMAYVGYLLFPFFVANYQLEDTMDSTARFGAVDVHKSELAMKEDVLKEARELNVPLESDDIHVRRTYNDVMIWGDYTVRVDMPFYPFDLHFEPKSQSKKHEYLPRLSGAN